MEPDLAGFAEAQQRLRAGFAEPVVFLFPVEATWPPGTPLDPETGGPYDPAVAPVASAQASAVVACDVASRVTAGGSVETGPAGHVEKGDMMLIADLAASGAVEGAVEFRVRTEGYRILAMRPDGVGGLQRWLTFGRRKS